MTARLGDSEAGVRRNAEGDRATGTHRTGARVGADLGAVVRRDVVDGVSSAVARLPGNGDAVCRANGESLDDRSVGNRLALREVRVRGVQTSGLPIGGVRSVTRRRSVGTLLEFDRRTVGRIGPIRQSTGPDRRNDRQ